MDVVLDLADEMILDCWWSHLFPDQQPHPPPFTNWTCAPTTTQQMNVDWIHHNHHLDSHQNHQLALDDNHLIPFLETTIQHVCASKFHRNHPLRQSVSIFCLTLFAVIITYFLLGTLSYYFIFDKRLKQHPKYLKNQVRLEIFCALKAFGPISLLSLPFFLAEVSGYSKLYDRVSDIEGISSYSIIKPILERFNLINYLQPDFYKNSLKINEDSKKSNNLHHNHLGNNLPDKNSISKDKIISIKSFIQYFTLYLFNVTSILDQTRFFFINFLHLKFGGGWFYFFFSYFWFLVFTDFTVYLVHKFEHHPIIYKRIHKVHHRWVIPTPFASYAFHPMDGFLQSLPYHLFIFIFPFHRLLYLFSFTMIILWTILIHDSEIIVGHKLENYINSPTHHTLHHLHFNCNFGQFFTWTDKFFNTYKTPNLNDLTSLNPTQSL